MKICQSRIKTLPITKCNLKTAKEFLILPNVVTLPKCGYTAIEPQILIDIWRSL